MRKADRVAVYIRLSSADEGTGRVKDESDSVVNQRNFINLFLDGRPEFSGMVRREFVDDGYSGMNVDRPAFHEMVEELKKGEFSVCITKDFSRFARDYIEMGYYLEYFFPLYRIRYISVNDSYDSRDYDGGTGGIDVVLKSFVYDSYSRDLSLKVKSSKRMAAEKGMRLASIPAYGYLPDPERKGFDIVDPDAAPVVRRIFNMALDGMKVGEIARILNGDKVLSPGEYYRSRHPGSNCFRGRVRKTGWDSKSVRTVLSKLCYTGASVSGTREKLRPGSGQTVAVPKAKWIVVDGMHEAIVSREEYERVQALISSGVRRTKYSTDVYPLRSRVFCGCCNLHATLDRNVFRCVHYYKSGSDECRGVKSPKMDELERLVFEGIREIIEVSSGDKVEMLKREDRSSMRRVEALRAEIEELGARRMQRYEEYVDGSINRDAFLSEKGEIVERIGVIEGEIEDIERRDSERGEASGFVSLCERFSVEERLTREMVEAFVDRVEIFQDERVEIRWKFGEV